MMENTVSIHTLFEKIAVSDSKAFQTFFDFTYSQVYRYAGYFIGDAELCKDVISDVYAHIWSNRKKLPAVENWENYLFICVRNRALWYIRQECRFQKIRIDDREISTIQSIQINPEREMILDELRNIIELAVNSLPGRCRLIFFMVREEGMKYRDVAGVLGISERTVHAQMCIAIRRVGQAAREYLDYNNIK
jgi:RNA polymerase sigma-70 factor (ECF subfamily)